MDGDYRTSSLTGCWNTRVSRIDVDGWTDGSFLQVEGFGGATRTPRSAAAYGLQRVATTVKGNSYDY